MYSDTCWYLPFKIKFMSQDVFRDQKRSTNMSASKSPDVMQCLSCETSFKHLQTLLSAGPAASTLTSSGCQSVWCLVKTPWSAQRWQKVEKWQPVSQIWPWQQPEGPSGTPSPLSWCRAHCMLGREQMSQSDNKKYVHFTVFLRTQKLYKLYYFQNESCTTCY